MPGAATVVLLSRAQAALASDPGQRSAPLRGTSAALRGVLLPLLHQAAREGGRCRRLPLTAALAAVHHLLKGLLQLVDERQDEVQHLAPVGADVAAQHLQLLLVLVDAA
jgi:hypothetical protein